MVADDIIRVHIRIGQGLANALTSLARQKNLSRNDIIQRILAKELRGYYKEYLQSDEWQVKRKAALLRDGLRCQLCRGEKNLHVHHITYDNIYNEPLSDLITLCKQCHSKLHSKS